MVIAALLTITMCGCIELYEPYPGETCEFDGSYRLKYNCYGDKTRFDMEGTILYDGEIYHIRADGWDRETGTIYAYMIGPEDNILVGIDHGYGASTYYTSYDLDWRFDCAVNDR